MRGGAAAFFCVCSTLWALVEPDPNFPLGAGPDGTVYVMHLLEDGDLLIAGGFTTYNGTGASGVVRIRPDGSRAPGFPSGAFNGKVRALLRTPDGGWIAGGKFTLFAGRPRDHLAKLTPEGELDLLFRSGGAILRSGTNRWSEVKALGMQPDGRIIVGGDFDLADGQARENLLRLFPDGRVDPTFLSPPLSLNDLAVLPDGRILVCSPGWTSVTRLRPDGELDEAFPVQPAEVAGSNSRVLRLFADGRFLISGTDGLARLWPDGSLDPTFPQVERGAATVELQPDGGLILGGSYRHWNGWPRQGLIRLLPDRSLDLLWQAPTLTAANPIYGRTVWCMVRHPDGRLIIGGSSICSTIRFAPTWLRCERNPAARVFRSLTSSGIFLPRWRGSNCWWCAAETLPRPPLWTTSHETAQRWPGWTMKPFPAR